MHPLRLLLPALVTGVLLTGCDRNSSVQHEPDQSPAAGERGVKVVEDQERGERRAESRIGGCVAALVYRGMEPYTIVYRNTCAQPLGEKVALLGDEVTALFGGAGPPSEISSLYVGQLAETFPEIGERVVLAVTDTSQRKFEKALEHNQLNRFFAEHASDPDNYPEIIELFQRWNFRIVGISVEKVMVRPAEATPFRDKLLEEKVKPDRSLPYDAQAWFRLRYEVPPPND